MIKIKRTVSFLLALMMVLALIPRVTVRAAVGDGFFDDTPMTHPNTYINTGDQRKDIIGVALTQVGYTELNHSNNTKYGATLKINKLGWCGAFVSWCAIEAEVPNSVFPKTGVSAPYAFGLEEKYYPEYIPQPGDLFFAKDNSHVGLVYTVNVEEGYFMSLEGNVSYNSYEGVHTEKHWLSAEKYCSPNYQTDLKIIASGECGAYGGHMNWALSSKGELEIYGEGEMADYALGKAPWYEYRERITSVDIPEGVTTIGNGAFYECEALAKVTIPDSVTLIGENAFSYCVKLAELDLGKGLLTLGDLAFYGCAGLKNLVLPDSVTKIGNAAFYDCSALSDLKMGASLTTIGNSAFANCASLTEVTMPDSLKTIGNGAFFSCNGLTTVELPISVTNLGSDVFGVCTKLTAIQVAPGNQTFSSRDGVLFNEDQTVLLAYPGGKVGAYTIPDTVTAIGPQAFQACSGLTAITIPESVTDIGDNAFFWCDRLKDVTMPDSVTTIGASAFSYCLELTWVIFSASLERIGENAFSYCAKLSNVVFNGPAPTIVANAFTDVKMTADHYPDVGGSWTDAVKQNYGGTITWEEQACVHKYMGEESPPVIGAQGYITYTCIRCGDSYVGDYTDTVAMGACGTGVNWSLDIHGKLVISGSGAMANYEYTGGTSSNAPWAAYSGSISKVIVENGVTAIGSCAFLSFSALREVTIPESVTSIGASAFQWCPGLKEVHFEGSAPTIGANTFYSQALTAYYIADETWTDAVKQNYGGTVTWVAVEKCKDEFTDWMEIAIDGATYQIRICKKCGIVESNMPTDEAAKHKWLLKPYQEPDCTEPGCKAYIYCEDCDSTSKKEALDPLGHKYEDYLCSGCGDQLSIGDFDGDGSLTEADVIYLLWHTVDPENHPLVGGADFDRSGEVTEADVIYLLWHTVDPETYPLKN